MNPAKAANDRSPRTAPPTLGLVRPLVALCGNPQGKEDSLLAFKRFRVLWPRVRVAVSSGAERLFRGSRRPFAGFALSNQDPDLMEHCEASDGVILLNPSTNLVGKMASLIADCPPSIAAFTALEKGRRVWLVTRPLERSLEVRGVGAVLRDKLAVLEGFGIRLVTSWERLLEESGGVSAASSSTCKHGHQHPPGHVCDGSGKCEHGHGGGEDRYRTVELRPPTPGDCPACPVTDGCQKYCPELVVPVIQAGAVRVQGGLGHVGSGDMARMIDHTMLKADATEMEIRELCAEAREHVFASVCVNPGFVRLAARELAGTRVKVCTVIGFPLGATSTEAKVCETRQAILDGADEIDMVVNISALKNHEDGRVEEDIRQVVRASEGRIVKVILETALLTDEEKVRGCVLTKRAGAHFVKTSTGFSTGGATVEDVALMRRTVGPDMGVKASGGVRDLEGARAMLAAGATRIGASASVAIVTGKGAKSKGY